MDKNNDIQVNKVDRWNKYMVDISLWQVKDRVDNLVNNYGPQLSIGVIDAINDIYKALDEALDRFDELENKCKTKDDALQNMIREVAELEKEKIDLEVRMDQSDDLRSRNAKYAWAIKTILKKATFSPGHVAEELRFMARKSTTPKNVLERWKGYADEFLGEHSKLVDENKRLKKRNEELENALNGKKFTTWEELESEIFTSEEIAESKLRVEHMACDAMRTHYIQQMADENKWLKKKDEEVKKENDNLKQTLLNILEKLETKVGLRRIHLLDSYEDRANLIMVEHDKLLIKYEKLKGENNNLTTDAKRLSDAVDAWFDMFNDMRHKHDDLKKEYEKLKEKLNDKNKLIYKLTPRKGNAGNKRVPPTGCCGCCNICTLKDICWILND